MKDVLAHHHSQLLSRIDSVRQSRIIPQRQHSLDFFKLSDILHEQKQQKQQTQLQKSNSQIITVAAAAPAAVEESKQQRFRRKLQELRLTNDTKSAERFGEADTYHVYQQNKLFTNRVVLDARIRQFIERQKVLKRNLKVATQHQPKPTNQ